LSRWTPAIVLAVLASVPLWVTSLYVLHIFIIAGIFIIAAMSLNLLLGYAGQLSLGHVAFFGIGAYTSALISLGFDIHLTNDLAFGIEPQPVWLAMLAGLVVPGLFGLGVGRIASRLRGAYFVIVSISFAEVVRLVAVNWVELTQGPMALNNIPPLTPGIPGVFAFLFLRKPAYFYVVLVVAVACYVVIRRLVNSQAGRAMIALRENEALASSVGIDVTRYLVLATATSAAMVGAAGALALQRHHRLPARGRRRGPLPRPPDNRTATSRNCRDGHRAHVPEDQPVRRRERARQRDDRPAPALASTPDRHRARPLRGGAGRAGTAGRGVGHPAVHGPGGGRGRARRLAPLWRAAATRGRDRTRGAPLAPAAGRAGVGHEPGREGAFHGNAREDPRAGHHGCSSSSTTCAR
jgi:ABC-type branched-subunit amino acid transport system permease subunit